MPCPVLTYRSDAMSDTDMPWGSIAYACDMLCPIYWFACCLLLSAQDHAMRCPVVTCRVVPGGTTAEERGEPRAYVLHASSDTELAYASTEPAYVMCRIGLPTALIRAVRYRASVCGMWSDLASYAMSGTDLVCAATAYVREGISLRARYEPSCTGTAYGAKSLFASYAMPGADIAYWFALAYAMSDTDLVYGTARYGRLVPRRVTYGRYELRYRPTHARCDGRYWPSGCYYGLRASCTRPSTGATKTPTSRYCRRPVLCAVLFWPSVRCAIGQYYALPGTDLAGAATRLATR
eukprot:1763913-Rhodomonas_salina.2